MSVEKNNAKIRRSLKSLEGRDMIRIYQKQIDMGDEVFSDQQINRKLEIIKKAKHTFWDFSRRFF